MCGIVGAIAQRNVTPILLEGLRRLEYRGYDSAGVAVLDEEQRLGRQRALGKVIELENALADAPVTGQLGIAHTRWATHGEPAQRNAHPHMSKDTIALVHNGIIENHSQLREELIAEGYEFSSDTDTEVVVHLIHKLIDQGNDLLAAVNLAKDKLVGAYAIGVICTTEPERMIVARLGSPLVMGIGIGEHFIASDVAALLPVTRRFVFLEEGDTAEIYHDRYTIYDGKGVTVTREEKESELSADSVGKGEYRHYMLKEIYEQPSVLAETLEGRISDNKIQSGIFGYGAEDILTQVKNVHIIACGTSYHAGMVAKYWLESLANLPCSVEVASEYRYRSPVVPDNTLFITISQSGETADTLAALRMAQTRNYLASLAICNVPESSLIRESDFVLMTRAGPEIGVASTKAFTTQLVSLLLTTTYLARLQGLAEETEADIVRQLKHLPDVLRQALLLDESIEQMSEAFLDKHHALFLGRGDQYPVAMEGALKLKEISYIHAEAYAAGELKHGPLALVDDMMPIVAVAPKNDLLEKLNSNLQEVRARGGKLFLFADDTAEIDEVDGVTVIRVPAAGEFIAPMVYTIPLQLLSYHVAVIKGTDVDQPRNLAKSVTVE